MGLLDKSEKAESIPAAAPARDVKKKEGLLSKAENISSGKSSLLEKAEKIHEQDVNDLWQTSLAEAVSEPDDEFVFIGDEDRNLPETDLFAEWEEDAKKQSARLPVKPSSPEEESGLYYDDDDFSTSPSEYHIASKRKIENYQAIFEISKEIVNSAAYEDFYENLTFSILGQIGAESIIIFSSTNGDFTSLYAIDFQGVEPEAGWRISVGDELYSLMSGRMDVVYAGELVKKGIPVREEELLVKTRANLVIPLHYKNNFFGMIIVGKPVSGEEYTTDDIEFLQILGSVASSLIEKIYETEENKKELRHYKEVIKSNNTIFTLARKMSLARTIDDAYDLFITVMQNELKVSRFTILFLDIENEHLYKSFGSNLLYPETMSKFSFTDNTELVGLISNVMGVYRMDDYLENMEIRNIVTNDEMALMKEFTVIPFIHSEWLIGFVVIHEMLSPWTDSLRENAITLAEIIAPFFANLMILEERNKIFQSPFSPIEQKVDYEISRSDKFDTEFSILIIKIQDISRVLSITGGGYFSAYCDGIRKIINELSGDQDSSFRVGQGKYAVILHSRSKKEAEIFYKKLKTREKNLQTQYFQIQHKYLVQSYPDDIQDKTRILEIIEEF